LSDPDLVVREDIVGPWATHKHQRLRDYLEAYTTIMRRQRWCAGFEYIDAFAGTGRARLRDEGIRIDGSPRIALSLPHPFSAYTFIDTTPWRVEQLQTLKAEFPAQNIRIHREDCNEVIVRTITTRVRRETPRRAFVFLDPFGAQVAYDTLVQIAATRAIEILLHFPTMALNRAILRNRVDPSSGALGSAEMDRMWGNHDWQRLLYHAQPDLFGKVWDLKRRPTGARFLSSLFVEHRLKPLFPFVTAPIVIKNTHGADLYCLIFAGHNPTGAKIADAVFRRTLQPAAVPRSCVSLPLELTV
jgi:three-Cys-motif partner protein